MKKESPSPHSDIPPTRKRASRPFKTAGDLFLQRWPGFIIDVLHMGALGPRRVALDDPNSKPSPPYQLVDNPYSIIDVTDLVMVDPVGTGVSKAVGKSKNSDFWGVNQDIKSVSQFIKAYIKKNDRWNSPKFLLGRKLWNYPVGRHRGLSAGTGRH